MAITAYTSQRIKVSLEGAPSGQVGVIGITIYDAQNNVVTPRTTFGITEVVFGGGVYTTYITTPDAVGDYLIIWDDGSPSPEDLSVEELTITGANPAVIVPDPADGNTIDWSNDFGLERLEQQAFMALYDDLNIELGVGMSRWAIFDRNICSIQGKVYNPIKIELVKPQNFYYGHNPSLVEAPVEKYPNISVMAYRSRPSQDQLDHRPSYENSLYVELMVKSVKSEAEVNSRIKRTASAINNVLLRNDTLGHTQPRLQRPPTLDIADVFVRSERNSGGDKWYWQGARLEYVFSHISANY